jgi:c-di-GMP-binding flagellar brake protein YcgR
MESRRNHYRHYFGPGEQFSVRLESPVSRAALEGEILNLSADGMCVRLRATAMPFRLHDCIRVEATLPRTTVKLSIHAVLVRVERRGADTFACLQYLPTLIPNAVEGLRKTIWRFLLEEQRRERRNGPNTSPTTGAARFSA